MNKTLKIFLSVITISIFALFPFFALEVDKSELESAGSIDSVQFINYTGPHKIINTIEEIKNIGNTLGKTISDNPIENPNTVGNSDLYKVLHCVDPATTQGLDADILILGKYTSVDHIKNLRRIISAYLQIAYAYSKTDSDTLATFITVYNAVYRGNLDAFTKKYKNVVTSNLTSDKCGLSVNYVEWAGKTQIVIPLSDLTGGISTVDTSVISDTKVVESMKENPDKEIEVRKDMVDLKEREADKATEDAQVAQKEATQAKQEVIKEQTKLEEVKEVAKEAEKKAEENPEDPVLQTKAEEAKQEVAKQEEKVQEAKETVVEKEQVAAKEQAVADKKQTEAQTDRVEIAKDIQKIIEEQSVFDEVINAAYGLKVTDTQKFLSSLVLVDSKTGKIVKESPVTVIRNRTVYPVENYYIAVAGLSGGNSAVKLVQIDNQNMEIIKETNEILAENSVLTEKDGIYYVVIQEGRNNYVACYNKDLALQAKSDITVLPETAITVTEFGIMVADSYSTPKLLQIGNLKEIK